MKKKNEKTYTLKAYFRNAITLGMILLFFVVVSITLIVFIPNYDPIGHYVMTSIAFVFLLLLVAYVLFSMRNIYRFFYHNVFETTHYNLHQISEHQNTLALYVAGKVEEVNELNRQVALINVDLSISHLANAGTDYSRIPLVYLDEERKVVDHHSFHLLLPQLIASSPSYRNVLLCVSYPFEQSTLLPNEEKLLITALKKTFASYHGMLLSELKDKKGYYVYLPVVGSFSLIREEIESMIRELSLLRKNEEGLTIFVAPQFALVCYPYSDIDDLFPDIAYARRMGLPINFYLPNALDPLAIDKNRLTTTSMDLNLMSRILSTVSSLNSLMKEEEAMPIIRSTYKQVMEYLHIDVGCIAVYQEREEQFKTVLLVENVPGHLNVKEGEYADKDFSLAIASNVDNDSSFYAPNRRFVVRGLGKYFDHLGFASAFFYAVKDEEKKPYAILSFLNVEHPLLLNSYLVESLRLYCNKVGDYLLSLLRQRLYNVSTRMAMQVLKLTQNSVYAIESNSYHLNFLSDGIKALCPKAEFGQDCYKALYGLSSPCEDCPLATSLKKRSTLGPYQVETSLSLADSSDDRQRFLLVSRRAENELKDDLFDVDWLTHSFYSLIRSMNGQYSLSGRGYLLLLRIDNISTLLPLFGSEKINLAIRSFANALCELDHVSNVYTYKPDTLALLYEEMGQTDIITQCEKIFDLSRKSYFEDKKTLFDITYLPISYPQGYPDAPSFVKHTEVFYSSGSYQTNKNFIYLDESSYSRSADKNAFMLSVIEEKFSSKKDFEVLLQPVVEGRGRRIVSSELLLRLKDDYRKTYFNTGELIQTAAKNGKIGLISDALLDVIANLYQKYGITIFRVFGFASLTLNTDYEYLADPNFLPRVSSIVRQYHLPDGFLGLEINEWDVNAHYQEMKNYLARFSSLPIHLICDGYKGQYLSLDKLQDLGFRAFKVDRSLTGKIDTDRVKYNTVKALLDESKGSDLTPILLGVENQQQAKLILDIRPDARMQGYAFYHPLSENDLIAAIRSGNAYFRSDKNKEEKK